VSLTPGTRLGNYEIVTPLGAGGMGEVYRAKDLRLGREVALKVLPADVASHTDRLARLEREARAVAALNHPNIVVLYSVEDAGAVRFLTMELVEGQSLDRHLAQGGLPLPRVLDFGIALADALTAAHAKGVVHRDLKPANVMLTPDGRIKVLDFGLAKLTALEPEGDAMQLATMTTPISGEGRVVGTVSYMAPEQVRGAAVDSRSDLFALGVVLYELAAGRRPFAGASLADVASAILRDEPPPLAGLRADLPRGLQRIVGRCLEKDPARRVQTATDVRNELEQVRRALGSGAAAAETPTVPGFGGRPAIAVLPFENRSGDPEQEYFAEGLAEDLITRLSLWRTFPVISRSSSFTYKGKGVGLREVSSGLGVRYVVQGSVRKAGTRVRIAAQLLDALTEQNVWAQTYDRELTDVFDVQDEISEAIAASLVADLQHAEYAHIQHRRPESLEAWGLYQRALACFNRFTRENFEQARALLERATELEPRFSTAWARLAEVGIWQVLHNWTDSPERTLELALTQARHAVELDPRDAEAHIELSFALMTAGDGYAAIEEARRGLELNPSHIMAQLFHAYMWHMTGHPPEDSIELVHRAMRLSPRDPVEWLFYDVLASAYFNAGRFDEGLAASRRLIALWPEYYFGQLWCVMNAVGLGQLEVAQASIREAHGLVPELSLAMVRRVLGAMAPDVDRRMMGALQRAGLE
jgi:serine/threonine protein kinase